jgi:hypothetical protein
MSSWAARQIRVIVVGLTGSQYRNLHRKVGLAIDIRLLSPEEALRYRGSLPDLVVVTRFVQHKTYNRLRKVMGRERLHFLPRGTTAAVIKVVHAIIDGGSAFLPQR